MAARHFGPAVRRPSSVRPGNARLPPNYRLRPRRAEVPAEAGARSEPLARVEAVLFLAEEPLTARKVAAAADLADAAAARKLLTELQALLAAEESPFRVEEVAGGYQLLTRPEYFPWLVRLRRGAGDAHLSPTLMETLAVVAYRQPVTRADLEAVRGVHCGEALRQLMERKLVQIGGRDNSLGRPVLYVTTRIFLAAFGLRDLKELPPAGE